MSHNKHPKLILRSNKRPIKNAISQFLTEPPVEKGKNKKGAVIPEVPEVWEPSPPRDDSEDDSAKYFETTKKKILSITRTKDPKRTVVSKFFDKSNKKSDSETKNEIKAKPAVKAKPKKSDKKDLEKQKSQPSIRNVINRKEETLFQKAVQNDCAETGIDPEQLQLAIAMSKSMAKEEESAEKFKNPFNSKDDKVKNFQKVLDQYGFKCKTRYTDYDLSALVSNKRKPKWLKRPTVLTRRTQNERDSIIKKRVDRILQRNVLQTPASTKPPLYYQVSSFLLNEYYDSRKPLLKKSSEADHTDESLSSYFVQDLFKISFVESGALLKDWSKLPGRDPTPERQVKIVEIINNSINERSEDHPQKSSPSSRSPHIFPDEDNKENEENVENKSTQLSLDGEYDSVDNIFTDLKSDSENDEDMVCAPKNTKQTSPRLSAVEEYAGSYYNIEEFDLFSSEDDDERVISKKRLLKGVVTVDLVSDEEEFTPLTQSDSIPKNSEVLDKSPIKLTQQQSNVISISSEELIATSQTVLSQIQKSSEGITEISELIPASQEKLHWESIDEDDLIAAGDSAIALNTSQGLVKEPSTKNLEAQTPGESNTTTHSSVIQEDEDDVDIFFANLAKMHARALHESDLTPEEISFHESPKDLWSSQALEKSQNLETFNKRSITETEDNYFSQQSQHSQLSSQLSQESNESIVISDEEVNYSIRNHRKASESDVEDIQYNSSQACYFEMDEEGSKEQEEEASQIIDLCDESLVEILDKEHPEDIHINSSVAQLLDISEVKDHKNFIKLEDQQVSNLLSSSIQELLANYEKDVQETAKDKSWLRKSGLKRIHSDSVVKFGENADNIVDMDLNQSCVGRFSRSPAANDDLQYNQNYPEDIEHEYYPTPSKQRKRSKSFTSKFQQLQNYGISTNPNYSVDTSPAPPMPDYKKMDAACLKFELHKIGVRALPVKKAVELLEHIWNREHPEIRIQLDADEPIVNESRRMFNATDLLPNIHVHDKDEFVFKPEMAQEEYILAKMKKGKYKSCSVPLHVAFYNMVRSNKKLQNDVLQYNPIDLDKISKHFKSLGLSYQSNDLIAFLDKRSITFKTEQNSYSNIHERKKLKRTQSTQARRK